MGKEKVTAVMVIPPEMAVFVFWDWKETSQAACKFDKKCLKADDNSPDQVYVNYLHFTSQT